MHRYHTNYQYRWQKSVNKTSKEVMDDTPSILNELTIALEAMNSNFDT